jgi:glyoxylase-like metal-dependent hydrolase (beta-lactamase superfamily II)
MIHIETFTFNPFYENTYVLSDMTKSCIIIDPGCFNSEEQQELKAYIDKHSLHPIRLLNTHCHVDHVFGNRFVADTWKLQLEIHSADIPILQSFLQVSRMYGFPGDEQPKPSRFLEDGEIIRLGNYELQVIFTPGHAPGHVCFYCVTENFLIGGDVLFRNSVGRTDLPGGNSTVLLSSIRNRLFTLPENVTVYAGHGPTTTIGYEKQNNPFAGLTV